MGRAVFNGFRKLLCSSKLYITAVILFSCIYTGFGGINGYLMRQGQTVQAGELFVFGMDSWIPQLIITVAFLILVNDIPFGKSGAQLQLIRSSRSRWLLGQTLSGFSTAAVYLILVELLFVVTTVRNLSFSDEWSQPVILAARLGKCTAIGIETAVRFPMSVLMNKSAWAVFGVAWLYAWLLYGFFCLILIVSNLKFHTNVGYMLVVLCLIFKRFLEYVPEVSLLKYISPCDVASISARPITAVNVIYTVLFFLVADWILWRAARRQMEQVKLDPSSRKHVGKYSLGMRQRLGIAQAIMERPRYLILDEPMNGLDTQGMEDVRELLQKQKETGVTVILASHSMEDIRLLCDTVHRIQDASLIPCTTEFS